MPRHYSLYLHICVFHSHPSSLFLSIKKIVFFLFYFFTTIIIIIMIIIIWFLLFYFISLFVKQSRNEVWFLRALRNLGSSLIVSLLCRLWEVPYSQNFLYYFECYMVIVIIVIYYCLFCEKRKNELKGIRVVYYQQNKLLQWWFENVLGMIDNHSL